MVYTKKSSSMTSTSHSDAKLRQSHNIFLLYNNSLMWQLLFILFFFLSGQFCVFSTEIQRSYLYVWELVRVFCRSLSLFHYLVLEHFLLIAFELFHCVFRFIRCADISRVYHAIEIYGGKTDILTCMRLIVACLCRCERLSMCVRDNKFSFSLVKSISAVHDVKICVTCAGPKHLLARSAEWFASWDKMGEECSWKMLPTKCHTEGIPLGSHILWFQQTIQTNKRAPILHTTFSCHYEKQRSYTRMYALFTRIRIARLFSCCWRLFHFFCTVQSNSLNFFAIYINEHAADTGSLQWMQWKTVKKWKE